ncbi:MAG TPA: 5-oxoprolinase subunit PxpB [Bacillota bacterium]
MTSRGAGTGADDVRFAPAGDQGIYVYFEQRIDPAVSRRVRRLALSLQGPDARSMGIREAVPAYASVYVVFDPLWMDHDQAADLCRRLLDEPPGGAEPPARRFRLPVVYGGEFGPDLDAVARRAGLTPEEVIQEHAGTDYYVYFTGFSPGFPFLGGMSPRIATPRRATPRTRVPAGSVGIAGEQTGVYPVASPGGWNLIGRTPVPLFAADRDPPALLAAGDYVRFEPVAPDAYARIEAAVAAGTYTLRPEPVDGWASGSGRQREAGRR